MVIKERGVQVQSTQQGFLGMVNIFTLEYICQCHVLSYVSQSM